MREGEDRTDLPGISTYTPVFAELGTVLLAAVLTYAGLKVYGRQKIAFFLLGSVLWTSIIENLGVIDGSYTYSTYMGSFGGWYPGYLLWVGLVPLWIELGWIIVALSLFMVFHEVLLSGRRPLLQALCAGLFAVDIDAMIDPVAVANRLWEWLRPSLYVLGVPLYNWVGWFLLIFFYDLTFNYTIIEGRSVFILGKIEDFFLRGGWSLRQRTARFAFRIVLTNFFIVVILSAISRWMTSVAAALVVA